MNKQTLGKFDQNTSRKKSIVVCLLAATLLVSMVGMASAVIQTWTFEDTNYGEASALDGQTPHVLDETMHVTGGCSGSYTEVTISNGHPAWWYDKKAQVNGSFGTSAENNWQLKIYHPSDLAGKKLFGEVWLVWDNGTLVKKLASGSGTIKAGYGTTSVDLPDNPGENQDFKVDQRLAVKVYTDDATGFKIYYAGVSGCSELESPPSDPGFPVPELPTIILMSTGLLALAGFVVYSRSRRRNGKAQ